MSARSAWTQIVRRLRAVFARDAVEREMRNELELHVDLEARDNERRGMPAKEARRAALITFGGVESVKEAYRDARGVRPLENAVNDLRYAVRTLARNPSFTLAVLLTLALGIGANTAVFAVVDAVLLRPLPLPEPDRIITLHHRDRRTGITKEFIAAGDYFDFRDRQIFESMGAFGGGEASLFLPGEPVRVRTLSASPGALQALRLRTILGRGITAEDGRNGAAPVLVLGYDTWRNQFAADSSVIGRTVKLETIDRQIVGVAEPGFRFPPNAKTDIIVAQRDPAQLPPNRRFGWITSVARLKPGQTLESAGAALLRLSRQWERDYPQSNAGSEYYPVRLRDDLVGNATKALVLLLAAVAVLLLVACANVANLVLARSLARRQEMMVRVALGAGRGRLMAQLLTENLVLTVTGGILGVLVARYGARGIAALVPKSVRAPGLADVHVGATVLFFAIALMIVTGIALGAISAYGVYKRAVRESLIGSVRMTMSSRARRSASALVMAEVALAIILLVGATLILRTFQRLMQVDPGFQPANVLTFDLQLPSQRYADSLARSAFYSRADAELRAMSGVQEVGTGVVMPLTGNNWTIPFERADRPVPAGERPPDVGWQQASGGFFKALGIPLVAGRVFDANDRPGSPPVVVISEAIQKRFFDGEDAVGKQIRLSAQQTAEIVGVVGNIRRAGLRDDPRADMYLPFERSPALGITFFIRTTGAPNRALADIQRTLRAIEPNVVIANPQTLDDVASESVRDTKLMLWLLGLFAGTAMLLAAIGIYGVTAYVVKQRTREIGARVALGASPRSILQMVMGDSMRVAGLGVVLGLGITFVATRLIAAMLYGVRPGDPTAILAAATLMVIVAGVAGFIPALRASRVDPVVALRSE